LSDVTVGKLGQFDVVLYNGIFYHVVDPIHHLIELAKIARHMLTVETWIDNLDVPRAVMNFFPAEQTPPGHPKWGWGPNSLLMHALLKRIGFATVLEFPTPVIDVHEARRSIFLAFQPGHPFADFVAQHADRAKPRFTGAPPNPEEDAPAPLNVQVQASVQALRAEAEALRAETKRLSTMNSALLRSTSWRVTAPLRAMVHAVRR
jgi:hypothetical protein